MNRQNRDMKYDDNTRTLKFKLQLDVKSRSRKQCFRIDTISKVYHCVDKCVNILRY